MQWRVRKFLWFKNLKEKKLIWFDIANIFVWQIFCAFCNQHLLFNVSSFIAAVYYSVFRSARTSCRDFDACQPVLHKIFPPPWYFPSLFFSVLLLLHKKYFPSPNIFLPFLIFQKNIFFIQIFSSISFSIFSPPHKIFSFHHSSLLFLPPISDLSKIYIFFSKCFPTFPFPNVFLLLFLVLLLIFLEHEI